MNDDSQPSKQSGVLQAADVNRVEYFSSDRELFDRQLSEFVPPKAFDVHAHLYDLRHLVSVACHTEFHGSPLIGHQMLVSCMRQWMGDQVIVDGLYFPFPSSVVDCDAANHFLSETLQNENGSRGLMLIRPNDDPDHVESELLKHGWVGFKVYHVFAERRDTFYAEQGEFLPEWAWQLAQKHSLAIMMHMVLPSALNDRRNQEYIREHCVRYPRAKLVLAHAARGFNANHTVAAIDSLRGLPNVWFDTSAVCESAALEAILSTFGTTRLMYGSDFPVSELRGRCVSIGDGFFWLHDYNAQWETSPTSTPQLVGIESLLALKQACRTMKLRDKDIESIFAGNARQLLNLDCRSDPELGELDTKSKGDDGQELYATARRLMPGGTQLLSKRPEMFAPGKWPPYYEQAIGCEVIDADGRRFIDMSHCGILSTILGFSDPDVNAAVIRRVHLGSMATQQTADEVALASLLTEIHPWADQARFTRSGGDAMAVAVRIARAATGRSKIAVCGYHGWHDWYLAANLGDGLSGSADYQLDGHLLPGLVPIGVPRELAGTVVVFEYNNLDQFHQAIDQCGDDLAAVVMEPTRGIDPAAGFLEEIRERVDERDSVLVFDEISSGWRLCLGGAHLKFGVEPDLSVFAKGMSNGFAMGAILGRASKMQACQDSFISSTYWTEGIGPAAALACIQKMQRIDVPAHLARIGSRVIQGWERLAKKHRLAIKIGGRPASCTLAFDGSENAELLTLMTTRMLERGFLVAGVCSVTLAHDEHIVDLYLDSLDDVFAELSIAVANGDVLERLEGPVKHSGFRRLVD